MKTQTAYVVGQQTRADNWENWQRTSWPVMASDKDNARTTARTAAKLQGLNVGECYSVKEV